LCLFLAFKAMSAFKADGVKVNYLHVLPVVQNMVRLNCNVFYYIYIFTMLSMLWCYGLGDRKGIRPVKKLSGGVLTWLSVWSELQTCIWPSWYHCHSQSLASVKSRFVLPFWYWLTLAVPEKGPLNVSVCVCVIFLLTNDDWAIERYIIIYIWSWQDLWRRSEWSTQCIHLLMKCLHGHVWPTLRM